MSMDRGNEGEGSVNAAACTVVCAKAWTHFLHFIHRNGVATPTSHIVIAVVGCVAQRKNVRYSFPGELSCPALDLQLTGDHLCR